LGGTRHPRARARGYDRAPPAGADNDSGLLTTNSTTMSGTMHFVLAGGWPRQLSVDRTDGLW
jgi:hypothetical protein